MKNNLGLIVAGVLVVGAAIAVVVDNNAKQVDRDDRVGSLIMAPGQLNRVDLIKIQKADKTVALKRENNRWQTADELALPVDANKVVGLLEALSTAKITRLVAEGADNLKTLEFGVGTTIEVGAGGKTVLQLTVGKNRDKGGQYVKFADGTKGFQIDQALRASPDIDAWELKVLVDVKSETIKRVNINPEVGLKKKSVTVAREKKEDPLKVADLGDTEQEKGGPAALDRILTGVRFSKRLDKGNAEAAAAMEKVSRAEVELFSGLKYQIEIGKFGDETPKYFMRVSADSGNAQLDEVQTQGIETLNRLNDTWTYEVASFVGQKFEKGRADYVEAKTADGKSSQKPAEPSDKQKSE